MFPQKDVRYIYIIITLSLAFTTGIVMKNAYRFFVGLLVLTLSSLAYADPDNPFPINYAYDVNDIVSYMSPSETVWVQGTNGDIVLYSGTTPGVPESSEGMIIGGAGAASQINAIMNDLNNISQTTVRSDGVLTVAKVSGSSDIFYNSLSIEGGSVKYDKDYLNMASSSITFSSGTLEFAQTRIRLGYDDSTVGKSTFNLSGGTVSLPNVSGNPFPIGYKVGSEGELNIYGGTFTTKAQTKIGDKGAGTINLFGGEFIEDGDWINMAYEAGSKGTLNVNGGTLTYTSQDFRVGRAGEAKVTLESGTINLGSKTLIVACKSGSLGEFTMTGGSLTAGAITLGEEASANGTATLSSGVVSFSGDITVGNSGIGTLTISGSGTQISSDHYIIVANAAGSTGVLNVEGGSLTGSDQLRVGVGGDGTMNINGGDVTAYGLANIGYDFGSTGKVSISNGSLTIAYADKSFRIGRAGSGTVEVLEGGRLIANNNETQLGFTYDSSAGVAGNGALKINGGSAELKALQIGYVTKSTGYFEINSGKLDVANGIKVGADGVGSATISGGEVNASSMVVKDNGSSLTITGGAVTVPEIATADSLTWTGGSLDTQTVTGNLVQNGGVLYPGISTIVAAEVLGSYTQSSDGEIVIDVDQSSNVWDTITVSGGDLDLNGTLFVNFAQDVEPADTYQIFIVPNGNLDVADLSLEFPDWYSYARMWSLNADGKLVFGADPGPGPGPGPTPGPGSGVPEPSTWALMILGAAGLLFVRKRKN